MSVNSITRVLRRRIGTALMMFGVAALVAGVIGRATWEPEPIEDVAVGIDDAVVSTTTSTVAPPSTATAPTTTAPMDTSAPTTTVLPEESVEDFVVVLATAMAATDVDTLTARLHPEVLVRYGEEQCRAYVATQGDPSFGLAFVSATEPEMWNYATDALSAGVPDTFTATVDQTRAGETIRREIHFAHFEGGIRWFSDCGTPVT